MIKFEIVEQYKDKNINLPVRGTKGSAGYDLEAAEDMVVPSYLKIFKQEEDKDHTMFKCETMESAKSKISKRIVTMIPTGVKAKMPENVVLKLYPRSSTSTKLLLQLANQTGIIDSDYYNNPNNEGHIFVPIINLSQYDIVIKKGTKIAQGIFEPYLITDDDNSSEKRKGGFGSTGE